MPRSLEPETKALLAGAFQAPVVEIYQASEGQIASPCRCGKLHINEDLVYVELMMHRVGLSASLKTDGRRA
jgi:phenylacetate-coenzyme A ligase PaaK-like adenylate-forming protein